MKIADLFVYVKIILYLCTRFGCITRSARNRKVLKSRNPTYADLLFKGKG